MASPQLKNGFTSIANEILEALCKIRIPGEARQILDVILRQTYGWKRISQAISLNQFVKIIGMKKANVVRSIKTLENMKLIVVERDRYQKRYQGGIRSDTISSSIYRFNKDYHTWVPLRVVSEAIPGWYQKRYQGSITSDNRVVSEVIPPSFKEKIKKEKIKKNTMSGKPDVADEKIPFPEIIDHLNLITHKNFKPDNKNTKAHIRARWNQGFRLDDFKDVIEKKFGKWGHNPKMVDYLRPETLFGPKFEAYLNETECGPQLVSETTRQNMKNLDAWEKMHEEQDRIQAVNESAG